MGLESGDARVDDAPAELSAPQSGTEAAAPGLPPMEQQGQPPAGMVQAEPDLSEAGLAAEAARAESAKGKAPKPAAKAADAPPAPEVDAATAVEPEPAAAAADAAPEDPKPAEPAPGKLATQLRAREKRLVEQQTTFARERSEFDSYRKATESQIVQARADIDRGKQMVDTATAVIRLAQTKPMQLLENLGITREILAERYLTQRDEPGPAEAQTRLERELAATREQFQRELAEERQAREQERTQRQQVEAKAAAEREYARFVSTARGDDSRWPHASKLTEAKLRTRGDMIADQKVSQGVRPTFEEILDAIEEDMAEDVSLVTKAKLGKNPSAAAQPAPSAKPRTSPQAQPGVSRSQPAQPTLSSATAGERSSDLDTFDPLTATEEELLAATLREIEAEKVRRANGTARR